MATRTAKMVMRDDNVLVVTWEGITEADNGAAVAISRFADLTVQAVGDFDASGAITMEGSNDGGTSYGTLQEPDGTAIVLTTAQPVKIGVVPSLIRPRATAGTAVDMDVIIMARVP